MARTGRLLRRGKRMRKQALMVRGGWPGHDPVAATDVFIPTLEDAGFHLDIEGDPPFVAAVADQSLAQHRLQHLDAQRAHGDRGRVGVERPAGAYAALHA